ncbi:TPA: GNAT family N-acetyltransferase [Clostridioides difficile]|uniref:GNAT family N-acetyltransferase n=1 Tax=Clostridioides difficile TaxID=1496 RepID=UPI0002D37E8A|nr:GNAT family N-acetyltransferase [Clostridioides difficile]MDD6906724.1 GNAT family N-acetyltransferase [Finegoldia magna]EGT3716629.1 GNAT family N-acetyltransferase [Clostridioides difficile]EGT3793333.1 GNAT family N-acetyltransferase [Clostridioides difficile]EIS9387489.1 GNAT family N-acetyltransferase [Clostridioides difficile]EIS9449157.1 GNAT family N-acetyltransferase [Clostridioides difficile]
MLINNKFEITYDEVKKIHAKFLFDLYNEPTINSIAVNKKGIIEMSSILKTIDFFNTTNNSLFIVSINSAKIGVGMIYDVNLEQNVCSLGIVLNPEYRNKGFGTLILEDLIEIAKNSLNVNSIIADINKENYKALNLVKNFNFKCINDKNSLSTYYMKI